MKKKLAIIGASYLQKPLVIKAKQMGYETHVFAWEEGAVCRVLADYFYPISITEHDAILDICSGMDFSGIVSIASDLATVAVNYVAERLGLIGNSMECTLISTNKYLMRKKLKDNGIACPRFTCFDAGSKFEDLEGMSLPIILKPVDRSGSRGVSLVGDILKLNIAIDCACRESLTGTAIIEEYIEGREISVETLSWKGEHYILQFTDKDTTGAPHFVEKGHHQPADLTQIEIELVSELVQKSLDALGVYYGASHTEIRINNDGKPYIIEVGARMGGDLIGSDLVELSTGYDFVKGVIQIATGAFEKPNLNRRGYSGIHYVYPKPGILTGVVYKGSDYVVSHDVLVPIGHNIIKISDSSQRPAYYIYKSLRKIDYDPNELVLITEDRVENTI
ncbi:MAG TPA: ATP-grasp domain-containing protein [Candidatus Cloacimonadota bacterium]|nr:ATP-grasp domain-containing protein [Candidatus Cloacimonadota bacterium]